MQQTIDGLTYDTDKAKYVCDLRCSHNAGDFAYHATLLYRTAAGRYFLAGHGGPMSMWAQPIGNSGRGGGSGIRPLDTDEARGHAERAGLDADELRAAGFEVRDA